MIPRMARRLALAMAELGLCLAPLHPGAALDPAQARGKQIYHQGTSGDGGEIVQKAQAHLSTSQAQSR